MFKKYEESLKMERIRLKVGWVWQLTVAIIAFFIIQNSNVAAENGLMAHWKMDKIEDNVVKDSSGNGFDAIFRSHDKELKPEFVPGVTGKAMRFRQGQAAWLNVDNTDKLFTEEHFTIMAWVKPKMLCNVISEGRIAPLVWLCSGSQFKEQGKKRHGWVFRYYKNNVFFYHFHPDAESGKRLDGKSGSVPIDSWTHIAVVYSGKELRLYIAGEEHASIKTDGILKLKQTPLIIGNYLTNKSTFAFDGLLDEVKIFNKALTKDEIWEESLPKE